ncbi:MAG: GNAT family N-acetyltransferase [Candidatus Helarchaeota archaeon]
MTGLLIIRQPRTKAEFQSMLDLRWRVLRAPWNQPHGSETDDKEKDAMHFIAIIHNKIIGTARLHKITENVGQIRYLAVEENYRSKNVGSSILEAIHLTAINQSLKFLILNARAHAISFFLKNGYEILEDGPLLFGKIKHKKMIKRFKQYKSRLKMIVENLKKSL